ncbi:MAG: UvrD-helicase domain-containing protein [Firmicutes bacterium]|nr:UvrD-helicase domain-containing protein [Bacillota bacterium]
MKPVLQTQGPVLVLAGAGSGKTRVLAHRIYHLINNLKVNPSNILAITFTNKAADEMKERLCKMLDSIFGMWVCTIHSMCVRILRMSADKLEYTKDFSIYSADDSERIIKRILKDLKIDDDKLKSVKWHISNAKNHNYLPDEYFKTGTSDKDIIKAYKAYDEILKTNNALDFDDLLTKTYKLLTCFPEVLEYFSDKFEYIHIDEFQDTNEIQYKLALMLSSRHKNIFAVGDDDQSIYSFRGANVGNILDFQKQFPDVKIFKLERNYRSTKKILNAANHIIKNNRQRMEKTLWTENSDGVKIETYYGFDENYEANHVVNTIKSLTDYGYKYSDFAILMRVNALSRSFEAECLKYNIPSRVFGGFRFFERKEIKDIVSYLRIVVNPFDEEAILRVINVPKRGIGEAAVLNLKNYANANDVTLYDVILNIEKTELNKPLINKVLPFKSLILDLIKANLSLSALDFIDYCIKATNILSMFDDDSEESINKKLNIDEFIASAKDFFKANEFADLSDYLQSITLISDMEEEAVSDNFVTISTVHAAKGLEYKVVFIAGLDDGIFPINNSDNYDLEEERRLMYVAITRAKERLYLTRAKSRFLYGNRSLTLESRFLKELDEILRPNSFSNIARREVDDTDLSDDFSRPKLAPINEREMYKRDTEKKDYSAFTVGKKVLHPRFGEGTILKTDTQGYNVYCDIAFLGVGIKTLCLQFAPLTLM